MTPLAVRVAGRTVASGLQQIRKARRVDNPCRAKGAQGLQGLSPVTRTWARALCAVAIIPSSSAWVATPMTRSVMAWSTMARFSSVRNRCVRYDLRRVAK